MLTEIIDVFDDLACGDVNGSIKAKIAVKVE